MADPPFDPLKEYDYLNGLSDEEIRDHVVQAGRHAQREQLAAVFEEFERMTDSVWDERIVDALDERTWVAFTAVSHTLAALLQPDPPWHFIYRFCTATARHRADFRSA